MELFTDSSSQVNQSFIEVASAKLLVVSMKFGVSFLHQWHPEFLRVIAIAIEWSFAVGVIRNSSVNNNILPSSIFEKLENSKTVFNSIIDNQVF